MVPVYNFRWTQPAIDFFELNVDAAEPNEDGKWGMASSDKGRRGCLCNVDITMLLKRKKETRMKGHKPIPNKRNKEAFRDNFEMTLEQML